MTLSNIRHADGSADDFCVGVPGVLVGSLLLVCRRPSCGFFVFSLQAVPLKMFIAHLSFLHCTHSRGRLDFPPKQFVTLVGLCNTSESVAITAQAISVVAILKLL